jgi:hypothetical protein
MDIPTSIALAMSRQNKPEKKRYMRRKKTGIMRPPETRPECPCGGKLVFGSKNGEYCGRCKDKQDEERKRAESSKHNQRSTPAAKEGDEQLTRSEADRRFGQLQRQIEKLSSTVGET